MKIYTSIIFASAVLLSACSEKPATTDSAAPAPAPVTEPASASAPASEASAQAATATATATAPAQSVVSYKCQSGEVVMASYPDTESAKIEYKSQNHDMKIAVSGSGARYVAENLEWWTKGSGPGAEGTLMHHNADGTSGDTIEQCTQS